MVTKISRRQFLTGAVVLGGGLVAARVARNIYRRDFDYSRTEEYLSNIQPPENLNELPNIIVILVDDLGHGDLGVYGSEVIQTPHIDRMAVYVGCLEKRRRIPIREIKGRSSLGYGPSLLPSTAAEET